MSAESIARQRSAMKRDNHMARPSESVYIACANLDFSWMPSEIRTVKKLRLMGKSINEIAEIIERPSEEVQILFIDMEGKRVNC